MTISRLTELELKEIHRKVIPDDEDTIIRAIAEAYGLGCKDATEKFESTVIDIFNRRMPSTR